jgi:hypothetical protein
MTRSLQVALGDRAYPIHIGQRLLADPRWYQRHIRGRQVMIVTNETVAPLYLAQVIQALAGYQVAQVILPDGEQYKTLEVWNRIFDGLLGNRFGRDCTLVALGGAWWAIWPALPPPATSAASPSSRSPPPCWPRSIPPSAARPASIIRSART